MWDGSQQVFAHGADELMDELMRGILDHGDLARALRQLYQRGLKGQQGQRLTGLSDLMEQLRRQRQEQLQRYNLDSIMDDLRQRLDQVVDTERRGMERRLGEARQRQQQAEKDAARERLLKLLEEQVGKSKQFLDNLPQNLPGAIKALTGYEFMDPEAARQFRELLDMLKGRMLDNFFQDLRQGLQGMTPQAMAAVRDMARALNEMLRQRAQGGQPDFQGFMERFGQMFGPNPPGSLDELLERLQRQLAQFQSLLDSMSPEQRQELERLLDQVLDPETTEELAQLAAMLEQMLPLEELRQQYRFLGQESLTLDEAMSMMARLGSLDELEQQLRDALRSGDLQALDADRIEELLGQEARRNLEQLQHIAQKLEEAGYIQRKGKRLELTARGIRRLAQRALREVFQRLAKDRIGGHDAARRGAGGEYSGETKPFEFGDTLDLDLEKTLLNATLREGPGTPVHVAPGDFEVRRTEHRTQAATVLMLDQSRSMGLFGGFQAAKKVALALEALIQGQFSRDALYFIGFSDYATEIKGEELPSVTWNAFVSGTNMHHALMLSRKLLSRHKGMTRQVIMITDGEPTAHLEGSRAYFSYPPTYRTIQETLKEARRCTQEGITINTFMLETNAQLQAFVDRLTRINRGRAFYTSPDRLGEYVLVDYVANRRKRLTA